MNNYNYEFVQYNEGYDAKIFLTSLEDNIRVETGQRDFFAKAKVIDSYHQKKMLRSDHISGIKEIGEA